MSNGVARSPLYGAAMRRAALALRNVGIGAVEGSRMKPRRTRTPRIQVRVPMAKLRIGEQLAWLNARLP